MKSILIYLNSDTLLSLDRICSILLKLGFQENKILFNPNKNLYLIDEASMFVIASNNLNIPYASKEIKLIKQLSEVYSIPLYFIYSNVSN